MDQAVEPSKVPEVTLVFWLSNGGLAFSRFYASAILAAVIVGCVALLPQRAGAHPGKPQPTHV